MTLPDYRALLARLYGFHWPLERGLRLTAVEILDGFDVRARERSPDLRRDLLALGMTPTEIDLLPLCDGLLPVQKNAELLGQLYVVEGAGLGGRVLAAKLEGILNDENTEGRRFFSGRTPPDPLPWPVFCRWLERPCARADVGVVVASALTTFQTMAQWLSEGEHRV